MAALAEALSHSSCQHSTSGLSASTQRRASAVCKAMPPQLCVMKARAVGWTSSASECVGDGRLLRYGGGGSSSRGSCGAESVSQGRSCTGTDPSSWTP